MRMATTLAPQFGREVLRCNHCDLVQFATPKKLCRRCRQPYDWECAIEAEQTENSRKLELNRQPVDVRPLLEHAMKTYCANAAARKKLRVAIQIIATETHVLADSSRMTQVFWNLLQNSCKFTPESGDHACRASS